MPSSHYSLIILMEVIEMGFFSDLWYEIQDATIQFVGGAWIAILSCATVAGLFLGFKWLLAG